MGKRPPASHSVATARPTAATSAAVSALPGYEGDGNIFNPAGGGYVATVGTTNFSTLDSFAEFWYVLQYYYYGSPIQSDDQTNGNIGTRSDSRSIQGARYSSLPAAATSAFRRCRAT